MLLLKSTNTNIVQVSICQKLPRFAREGAHPPPAPSPYLSFMLDPPFRIPVSAPVCCVCVYACCACVVLCVCCVVCCVCVCVCVCECIDLVSSRFEIHVGVSNSKFAHTRDSQQ